MKTHTYKNFTTTLPVSILQELDVVAKELRVQKNDVLTRAFSAWNKARKQAQLAASYKKLSSTDRKDFIAIADEGFEEWYSSIPS